MRFILRTLAGLSFVCAACGGDSTTQPQVTLTVTVPSSTVPSGTSVQATATSSSGGPASNVTWSTRNAAVATVSSIGEITGILQGTATIVAASGSVNGSVVVTVVPGAPAKVTIYAGNGQAGPHGSQLKDPLCTNVNDAAGNPIIGATVSYTVMTGGGTLAAPTSPATDGSGIAISGLWTLGAGTGAQTVMASSAGATSVTFTATSQ
jgi:hypothetical protein